MANFVFEIRTLITASILSAGFVLLAACDESDKRAEKHFHIAQQFISDGQIDQALAELIMVFQLKPEHKDARLAFAKIERARGNIDSAFDNYVKLVEYYPNLVEGRRALAEVAFSAGTSRTVPASNSGFALPAQVVYRRSLLGLGCA